MGNRSMKNIILLFFCCKDPLYMKEEKATIGITALSFLKVLIKEKDCDLDVESRYP